MVSREKVILKNANENDKYVYNENPFDYMIYYPNDNSGKYIDILDIGENEKRWITMNMNAYYLTYNFMVEYITYYALIKHKPFKTNLFDWVHKTLMDNARNEFTTGSINNRYVPIYDYIMGGVLPDTIRFALLHAEIACKERGSNVRLKESEDTFTISATRLKEYSNNHVMIEGLGVLHTNNTKPDVYKNKATIKITKSRYDEWYILDLGTLVKDNDAKYNKIYIDDSGRLIHEYPEIYL